MGRDAAGLALALQIKISCVEQVIKYIHTVLKETLKKCSRSQERRGRGFNTVPHGNSPTI